MPTWVSITSVGAHLAEQFERDLRLALCLEADVRFVPFQFDATLGEVAQSQVGATLATFLARQTGLAGVIWYELDALDLIEFAPAHLSHVLALAEISGWRAAQSAPARASVIGNLLARRSVADRITLCAPQRRAFASIAEALFPGKVVRAPIPFPAATGPVARDQGLSLGICADMSAEGWETLQPLLAALVGQDADADAPTVRIHAPPEFFASPYAWDLRGMAGVLLVEGASADSRDYAGGDFLIGTAPDLHQLDMAARDAAAAGGALLILEHDTTRRETRIRDAAGAPVPLESLKGDARFRDGLREAFHRRASRASEQSVNFWKSLLRGEPGASKEADGDLIDAEAYRALTDRRVLPEETAVSRAFQLAPASAQHALDLAGVLSRTDPAASWPLVALANRLARSASAPPLRPSALGRGDGRLFVADDHGPRYSREQRSALQNWLDDLPPAPSQSTARGGKRPAFRDSFSDDPDISHSVGLSIDEEGQRQIAAEGALLFLRRPDVAESEELVVTMDFALAGEQATAHIDIEFIGGATRKVDLISHARQRVQIRAPAAQDDAFGIVLRLTPVELRWAHIRLVEVTVHSAEHQPQLTPEDLTSAGFDLLEAAPIGMMVISGAFDVEHDAHGHEFRWIARELFLKLPAGQPAAGREELAATPWLVLKLRPNPSSPPASMAADIDLPGPGGKRVGTSMRRLGAFDGDVLLGAPLKSWETGGIARVTLRGPNTPLSPVDSRLAAACLADIWIAVPSSSGRDTANPRFVPLKVTDGSHFPEGWYPVEDVKGLPSRWMTRAGVLSSGFRPRLDSRLFLAVAGPWLPRKNPALVPFTVTLDGRPMSVRSTIDSSQGWATLLEGEALDAAFPAEFELNAESSRVLGPKDPREGSILVSFALLIDPAGDPAPVTATFGDAEVMNCTLTVEHWGAGLSGAWLPPATIMACARPPGANRMVIEGAATTDTATVEGMGVEIDAVTVDADLTLAKDGGWVLRTPLEEAEGGGALLLRLIVPRTGRVMLRRVRFEREAAG